MIAKNFCLYSIGAAFLALTLLFVQATGTGAHVDEALMRTENLAGKHLVIQSYQMAEDHVAFRHLLKSYEAIPETARHESRQFNFTAVNLVRDLNDRLRELTGTASLGVQNADKRMVEFTRSGQQLADAASGARADLKPTLDHAAEVTGQVAAQAPEFLNCDPSAAHPHGNKNCLLLSYIDLKDDIHGFTFDAHREADKFTAEHCQQDNAFLRGLCHAYRDGIDPALGISRLVYYSGR